MPLFGQAAHCNILPEGIPGDEKPEVIPVMIRFVHHADPHRARLGQVLHGLPLSIPWITIDLDVPVLVQLEIKPVEWITFLQSLQHRHDLVPIITILIIRIPGEQILPGPNLGGNGIENILPVKMQQPSTPDNQEHLPGLLFRNARIGETNEPGLATREVVFLLPDIAPDLCHLAAFRLQLLFQLLDLLLDHSHFQIQLPDPGLGLLELFSLRHQNPQFLLRLLHFLGLHFSRILHFGQALPHLLVLLAQFRHHGHSHLRQIGPDALGRTRDIHLRYNQHHDENPHHVGHGVQQGIEISHRYAALFSPCHPLSAAC